MNNNRRDTLYKGQTHSNQVWGPDYAPVNFKHFFKVAESSLAANEIQERSGQIEAFECVWSHDSTQAFAAQTDSETDRPSRVEQSRAAFTTGTLDWCRLCFHLALTHYHIEPLWAGSTSSKECLALNTSVKSPHVLSLFTPVGKRRQQQILTKEEIYYTQGQLTPIKKHSLVISMDYLFFIHAAAVTTGASVFDCVLCSLIPRLHAINMSTW